MYNVVNQYITEQLKNRAGPDLQKLAGFTHTIKFQKFVFNIAMQCKKSLNQGQTQKMLDYKSINLVINDEVIS